MEEQVQTPWEWRLYTDEASSIEGLGAGLILINPIGIKLTYALHLNFPSTKNEAECEAVLAGLRLGLKIEVAHRHVYINSLLVANQGNVKLRKVL